ncbi:MAG TPA: ABC transporter permease [Candidatus Saccharimonadia bacterium]|nr:ABC transporter permease [Candidatus Saccharimonadia bacterium]
MSGPSASATAPAEAPAAATRRPPGRVAATWALISVPLTAVILGLVVGGVIIIASTWVATQVFDVTLPFVAYAAMLEGGLGSTTGIASSLVQTAPLLLTGLAVGVCFKAGLFNIGAQGQFLFGALGAAAVGAALAQSDAALAIPLAILAGIVLGAGWGFIPGFLKAVTGAHEVVTTIMLNFIALTIIGALVVGPLLGPGVASETADVGNAALPIVFGRNLHLGVLIAFAFVPIVYWLLWKTTIGFEVRTVGASPTAARYAGMRPGRVMIVTMTGAGAMAGLAGAGEILGISHTMSASFGGSIGFDAIAVALLGRAHPFGIMAAALLFGVMRAGAGLMQINASVPVEVVDVIQAVILFFLAADVIVRALLKLIHLRAGEAGVEELRTVTASYGQQTGR